MSLIKKVKLRVCSKHTESRNQSENGSCGVYTRSRSFELIWRSCYFFIKTKDTFGCLISFVLSDGDINKLTPVDFSSNYEELQKLCVLDIRFGNQDRNQNNILTKQDEDGIHRLIPINHAECYTGDKYTLKHMEWAIDKEIDLLFSLKMIEYVARLDASKDIEYLKNCGWSNIPPREFTVPFRIFTCFLKEAVDNGLTPKEIATLATGSYTEYKSLTFKKF
ncbi:unnamed protein product [Cochlearia groenlandica]